MIMMKDLKKVGFIGFTQAFEVSGGLTPKPGAA